MSYDIEVIRHSLAHVLAAAVKKVWPDAKFGGGPAIENGFYYDFDMEHRITEEDFPKIEKEMRDLIKGAGKFECRELATKDAAAAFKDEPFKMEWINELAGSSEQLSVYQFRDFIDLCRGPHVESSKELPRDSFKIRTVAGAYWRGDSKNKMLQRVYVDAFLTKEELDAHLLMMEEAAKRDHRKIGREMDLFHFQPEYAPGMVFWHDKGYKIYRRLIEFIRYRQERAGYLEISTPEVMDRALWETSGHWAKYASKNFTGTTEDERTFCIKPMSCPGGMLAYAHDTKSYRDLPLYVAEFGKVHRYESSGGLSGLMRVRGFVQDDAHIYCTPAQVTDEVIKTIKFIRDIYRTLGFEDMWIRFATRPESEFRIGDDAVWDKAESMLQAAADKSGTPYEIAPGDGAFYGPKLDFYLKDSLGREWQSGTIQLDLNLPERFDLSYIGEDNEKHRPVVLHRALLGSIDRFMGVWLEHNGGHLPLWISPEPVVIAPVSEKYDEYAAHVVAELQAAGVRARADVRSEKVNYKIRDLSLSKTPIIAVVGEKEAADQTVTLRYLGDEKQETRALSEFVKHMNDAVRMPE